MRTTTAMESMEATMRGLAAGTVAALGLLLAGAGGVQAQQPGGVTDGAGSWLPFVGCWEALGEDEPEGMLCIRQAGGGSAELLTVVDGAVQSRSVRNADGHATPTSEEGCRGEEEASFSADGRRIFTRTDLTCEGDVTWASSGLMAMISPSHWIDVQVSDVGGRDMAWVRHYRQAPAERVEAAGFPELAAVSGRAQQAARLAAAGRVDVDDVAEATGAVHPEAVKAWLAERNERFDLDADALVRMADAGVPGDVIDVVVAVSYPDRFAVDGTGRVDEYDRVADEAGYGPRRTVHAGWGGPWYGAYGSYRARRYGGYGIFPGYYGGGYYPRVIVVRERGRAESGGQVVEGRGYTRGRSSTSGGESSAGSSIRGSSGGSASGSSVRSGGSSSSSGSSTGRKAKRRGGGSGGSGGNDDGGGDGF